MKSKTLVGITHFTTGKAYVLPKFEEMLEECVVPVVGRNNIVVVGDNPICGDFSFHNMPCPGGYAEDMLMASREWMLQTAREMGYDKLVWQGVDALFQSKRDFERLVTFPRSFDLIAPLISARADANHAICRRFIQKDLAFSTKQVDIDPRELETGWLIKTGFPGADNIVLNSQTFDVPFTEGHDPWYKRVERGEDNVCVEEEWVRRCLAAGYQCWCDTAIKVWHVHEDGTANMFKGISKHMDEVRFNEAR